MLTKSFNELIKLRVWSKARILANYDPRIIRADECGAYMSYNEYGNRNSDLGWEIDHITPESKGGSDNISNLRPLQWQNNASKSDGRLVCVVKR